jgi:protein-tyrosine phosphatase
MFVRRSRAARPRRAADLPFPAFAALSPVRDRLRDAYHGLNRLLHPVRRRLAEGSLKGHPLPSSVLFVCHGNVCRSPYAEYIFRNSLSDSGKERMRIQSAGFIGPGRQPPDEALQAAQRRGIDMQAHRSQLIAESALRNADLVVVMAAEQARAFRAQFNARGSILILGDLDPESIDRRTIQDPWGCGAEIFDDCYARIDRCVERLVAIVDGNPAVRSAQ